MNFVRARKYDAAFTLVWPKVTDLIFDDGTAHEPLPASYTDRSRFVLPINGNQKIYIAVAIQALGGGGLTGIVVLIEFFDPTLGLWIPSKDGVARDVGTTAAHEWSLLNVGNFLVSSREEHKRFTQARVSFKAAAGSADSATKIHCSWEPDAHIAAVPDWAI